MNAQQTALLSGRDKVELTISKALRDVLEGLICREDIRSVSCPFLDCKIWRSMVTEQLRRAEQYNLPLQEAFCLCGPDSGLPDVPFAEWGGEVHIPYEGVCDGDLFIMPSWRRFRAERIKKGMLSLGVAKNCNHLLIHGYFGDFENVTTTTVGEWTLYSSQRAPADCNPFLEQRLRASRALNLVPELK